MKKHILKSTGEEIFPMPWHALTPAPWDAEVYSRFLIPNPHGTPHIQVIRNEKVVTQHLTEEIKYALTR